MSTVVKVNGITREVPTSSTAVVTLSGVAGTVINNGAIGDNLNLGTVWILPATVVLPPLGSVSITVESTVPGAITAAPGTLTVIRTPVAGWQSVTNPASAAQGQLLETDAALRRRQTASTAIPSQTVLAGILGALAALPGVTDVSAEENVGTATDVNGVPGHSVSFVVLGGAVQSIVDTIGLKKTIGTGTFGTTTGNYVDQAGIGHTIGYFVPTQNTISVSIHLTALTGYTTLVGVEIQQAVAAYINGLAIGSDVLISRLYVPANLFGPSASPASPGDTLTYDITSIQAAISPGTPGSTDVAIAFNAIAVCLPSNVTLVVT